MTDQYPSRGTYLKWTLVAVVALVAILVGGVYGLGWFKKGTADFRGGVSQTESVHASGAYRIAAYDRFFDLCGAIKAKERQIASMTAELNDPATTPERAMILRPSITGLSNVRDEQIEQYNADASKTDTRANFLASTLPYAINPEGETQCAI